MTSCRSPTAGPFPMIASLLAGNAKFVSNEFAPNAAYYHALVAHQRPKVLWIGCSDSRVSEHQMTDSKPGTMFVHRNVANIVAFNDVNISAILEYGVVHLKIEDIIVCGHTRCGGIAAIEDGVSENYIADWLCIATGAKEAADRIAARAGPRPGAETRGPHRGERQAPDQASPQSRAHQELARKRIGAADPWLALPRRDRHGGCPHRRPRGNAPVGLTSQGPQVRRGRRGPQCEEAGREKDAEAMTAGRASRRGVLAAD